MPTRGILLRSRARWGAGGALYPQPALAGLNSLSRFGFVGLMVPRGVEGRVPQRRGTVNRVRIGR